MQDHMTDHEREAYELGAEHARNAASWAVDGDMSERDIRRRLDMLDAGDPEAFDLLPAEPNLSGEWAGDLTPGTLAYQITDLDSDAPGFDALVDTLADAYEAGVRDTFESECERILREALS